METCLPALAKAARSRFIHENQLHLPHQIPTAQMYFQKHNDRCAPTNKYTQKKRYLEVIPGEIPWIERYPGEISFLDRKIKYKHFLNFIYRFNETQ